MIEALIDPWPPFTFCRPQATVDQDAELSPAKSEDRKGGEGKTDANLTNCFKHLLRRGRSSETRPREG